MDFLDVELLSSQLTVFITGFIDSLRIYRTFPLLVNSPILATTTFKIIGANCVLLFGSLTLFHKAITPGLSYLSGSIAENALDEQDSKTITGIIGAIFYALFVVPIYVLCYSTSMIWYQALADEMFQSTKKAPPPRLKAVVDATYGTVVWVCLFVQLQLLNAVVPILLAQLHSFFDLVIVGSPITGAAAGALPSSMAASTVRVLEMLLPHSKTSVLLCVSNASILSRALGWVLMSIMYGWYAFDNHWIADNVDPDTRFKIMEKHWAYFFGFGLPYTLLVKGTSFFVGYGGYLALFPFCIMLGGVSDYEEPYAAMEGTAGGGSKAKRPVLASLRVFRPAQVWALAILSMLRKKTASFDNAKAPAAAAERLSARRKKET